MAVAILLSYDDGFTDLMHRIFSADVSIADAFSHVNCALFGILLGMYLFGLYTASTDKEEHTRITADGLDKTARACRRLSAITVLCATVPILFLYAVFFVSQWQYYVSAFTGTLPENLSYAQYAREGFFQLCAVAVINLCMTAAASLLTRRKDEKPPVFLKIITVLYAAFTLVLIATAISKMILYIDTYGLTQKRVYTSVFMIAMAVVSHNAEKILSSGMVVFAVVILHNLLGSACGFGLGKALKLDVPKVKVKDFQTVCGMKIVRWRNPLLAASVNTKESL